MRKSLYNHCFGMGRWFASLLIKEIGDPKVKVWIEILIFLTTIPTATDSKKLKLDYLSKSD